MDGKLKKGLSSGLLGMVEKCVSRALMAAGVVGAAHASEAVAAVIPTSTETTPVVAAKVEQVAPATEGAILLNIVSKDPMTGEMIAGHHSHASHASHASHESHYSSRW